MNKSNLFKKCCPINCSFTKKTTETNALLYTYFLKHDFITRNKMLDLGVRNIDKKVNHINEQGRFFLEEVGNKFNVFLEEKLPTNKYETEDYNIKVRPKNKRLITRKYPRPY